MCDNQADHEPSECKCWQCSAYYLQVVARSAMIVFPHHRHIPP